MKTVWPRLSLLLNYGCIVAQFCFPDLADMMCKLHPGYAHHWRCMLEFRIGRMLPLWPDFTISSTYNGIHVVALNALELAPGPYISEYMLQWTRQNWPVKTQWPIYFLPTSHRRITMLEDSVGLGNLVTMWSPYVLWIGCTRNTVGLLRRRFWKKIKGTVTTVVVLGLSIIAVKSAQFSHCFQLYILS